MLMLNRWLALQCMRHPRTKNGYQRRSTYSTAIATADTAIAACAIGYNCRKEPACCVACVWVHCCGSMRGD
eukprot:scaffold9776_cov126-Isochrysis_galbana.AAC.7